MSQDGALRVVVNADDFGATPEISAGIEACMDAGVVTSTTILANQPGSEDALGRAAARCRGPEAHARSFGVHLNLCEGPALTGPSSLTDDAGVFVRKRAQALRAFALRLDPGDVERELAAQIARVRDAGVAISHLDGHKHLHQLPGVAEVVARLAAAHGIERVRCTRERGLWPPGVAPGAALSRLARRGLARALAPRLHAHGLRSPARTLDLAELMRLATTPARVARLAGSARASAVTEVFCHPGGPGRRAEESRFLLSPAFAELVREAGATLVSYWEV